MCVPVKSITTKCFGLTEVMCIPAHRHKTSSKRNRSLVNNMLPLGYHLKPMGQDYSVCVQIPNPDYRRCIPTAGHIYSNVYFGNAMEISQVDALYCRP